MIDEFLGWIFEPAGPDEHVLIGQGLKYTMRFGDADLSKLVDGYYCVATGTGRKKDSGTVARGRADLIAAYVLVIDDVGTKGGALPPIEPTYKIETSEGNFQWGYVLEAPVQLDVHGVLYERAVAAAAMQYGDPKATGAYRLMRLPGSINLKEGRGRFASRVTHWDTDATWTLERLISDLALVLEEPRQARVSPAQAAVSGASIAGDDPVLKWLVASGHVVADAGEWVEIVCPFAGRGGGHTTGNTAFYSPLGRGDGQYTGMRAFKCHHDHALETPRTAEFLDWVRGAGGPDVPANGAGDMVVDRYAFIGATNEVADMYAGPETLATMPLGNWMNSRCQVIGREGGRAVTVGGYWKAHPATVQLLAPINRPGDGRIVDWSGERYWNSWCAPRHVGGVEGGGDVGEFGRHLEHVVPDPVEQGLFWDWLACKIQRPDLRSYAVVMVADTAGANTYGIGRSMIGSMIRALLQAPSAVPSLELAEVLGEGSQGQFNDWAAAAQVVVVEETKETVGDWRSNTDHFEKLKKLIDVQVSRGVQIKKKYGGIWQADLYCNFLFFTNHYDALRLPEGDRRFAVLDNATTKRAPADYAAMAAAVADPTAIAQLYWWLMARDVSGFDRVTPPETDAKARMSAMSRTTGEDMLHEYLNSLDGDLITKNFLLKGGEEYGLAVGWDAEDRDLVKRMLKQFWAKECAPVKPSDRQNGGRTRVCGKVTPLRIMRNAATWLVAAGDNVEQRHHDEVMKNEP